MSKTTTVFLLLSLAFVSLSTGVRLATPDTPFQEFTEAYDDGYFQGYNDAMAEIKAKYPNIVVD
ncbi:MAG: hypothetical protein ACRCR2_02640 [Fusobacteriaceae bacterium]